MSFFKYPRYTPALLLICLLDILVVSPSQAGYFSRGIQIVTGMVQKISSSSSCQKELNLGSASLGGVALPEVSPGKLVGYKKFAAGIEYEVVIEMAKEADFFEIFKKFPALFTRNGIKVEILKNGFARVFLPDDHLLSDRILTQRMMGIDVASSFLFQGSAGATEVESFKSGLLEGFAPLSLGPLFGHDFFGHLLAYLVIPPGVLKYLQRRLQAENSLNWWSEEFNRMESYTGAMVAAMASNKTEDSLLLELTTYYEGIGYPIPDSNDLVLRNGISQSEAQTFARETLHRLQK